jgi:hypothetical protein
MFICAKNKEKEIEADKAVASLNHVNQFISPKASIHKIPAQSKEETKKDVNKEGNTSSSTSIKTNNKTKREDSNLAPSEEMSSVNKTGGSKKKESITSSETVIMKEAKYEEQKDSVDIGKASTASTTNEKAKKNLAKKRESIGSVGSTDEGETAVLKYIKRQPDSTVAKTSKERETSA